MMRLIVLTAALGLAAIAPACANRSGDQSIAEYCADPSRAQEDVCEVHAEMRSNDLSLGERIGQAFGLATDARDRADRAQSTADNALAMTSATELTCVTRALRNQQVGTCDPGYTLTACTQTRYTTRSGGMSILRELSDERCRFNTQVLEMQVRCCYAGPTPPPSTSTVSAPAPRSPPASTARPQRPPTS
ncbi:MAG: hypothetical protein KGS44_01305 [Alphaproteobacteria bacterium]|jgi:hypothetical protein|nr:hypothetical protein [Alphaproteobacteria bacterium]